MQSGIADLAPQTPANFHDFLDDFGADCFNICIRQCRVFRRESHVNCEGFLALVNALAAVHIEQADMRNELLIRAFGRFEDVARLHGFIDNKGEVAVNGHEV